MKKLFLFLIILGSNFQINSQIPCDSNDDCPKEEPHCFKLEGKGRCSGSGFDGH